MHSARVRRRVDTTQDRDGEGSAGHEPHYGAAWVPVHQHQLSPDRKALYNRHRRSGRRREGVLGRDLQLLGVLKQPLPSCREINL